MKKLLLITSFLVFISVTLASPIFAQGFGSDINNYECANYNGIDGVVSEIGGEIVCTYTDDAGRVLFQRPPILKPPPLQILQVWFVRILYVIWGISGVVFTFILISIGVQYMLSFGNEIAVGEVIKRFQKWVVGLALVFLSYPILATFFNVLPISETSCFNEIELPAFQFFFPTACLGCEQQCLSDFEDGLFGNPVDTGARQRLENCQAQCAAN